MSPEQQARCTADRVMLSFSVHLILLICSALFGVPSYSFLGILSQLIRFVIPILIMFFPPIEPTLPQMLPTTKGGWLDLIPAWALLLLLGLLLPGGGDSLPDAPLPFLFVQLVVLTPILEELLFRGIPLTLCKHFDKRIILLLLSLLFALLHSGYTKGYAFPAGMLLGIGMLLGRGLLFGIILHTCNNLATLLFLLLEQHAPAFFLPTYVIFVSLMVIGGAVIAFLRAKQGQYKLEKQVFPGDDGAPVPPARLATPLSVVLLICFVLVTILL